MKSKIGLILASIFIVFAVILDINAFICKEDPFCGLGALAPGMPISAIPAVLNNDSYLLNYGALIIGQIINAIIIYFIGVLISKIIKRLKS